MRAPCAAISNLGDRSSHAKESPLRVLPISSSSCGAPATLSRFLNNVTLPGGLLGRIPTHSNELGRVKSESCWIFSPGPHPLKAVFSDRLGSHIPDRVLFSRQ